METTSNTAKSKIYSKRFNEGDENLVFHNLTGKKTNQWHKWGGISTKKS